MFDLQCSNPALIADAWSDCTDTEMAGERTRLATMKKKLEATESLSGSPDFLRYFHECITRQESRSALPPLRRRYYSDEVEDKILVRVAERIKAPQTLKTLSTHASYEVRQAVAENEFTPKDALFSLATDSNADVRYRLAETYCTPVDILGHLLADENPYVAARAQTTIKRLAAQTRSEVRPLFASTARQNCRSKGRSTDAGAPNKVTAMLTATSR